MGKNAKNNEVKKDEAATGSAAPNRETRRRNRRGRKERKNDTKPTASNASNGFVGGNDISWYSKYPNLLAAAAQAQFVFRPGMQLPLGGTDSSVYQQEIPGIWTIDWAPAVGRSASASDPASLIGFEIYARVRAAFSGELSVDAPDFVMYLVALDSIFSYIAALKRLYRIIDAYSPENFVIPDTLAMSTGFLGDSVNYDSVVLLNQLRSRKTDFFAAINELIYMTNRFKCPAIMDYFNRHYWMNDNVYTDAPTADAQFYIFVQKYFYKLIEGESGNPPRLVPTPYLPNVKSTDVVSDLFLFGKALLDALSESDDWYTASGYLMRAYDGSPNFVIEPLAAADFLNPVYSEEVLSQIENATTLPFAPMNFAQGFTITQNVKTNAVVCSQVIESGHFVVDTTHPFNNWFEALGGSATTKLRNIINIHSATPTPENVVIATRLKTTFQELLTMGSAGGEGPETQWLTCTVNCASEVVLSFHYYRKREGYESSRPTEVYQYDFGTYWGFNDNQSVSTALDYYGSIEIDPTLKASVALERLLKLSSFDWHPFLAIVTSQGRLNYFGDFASLASMEDEALKQLNKICLFSEFNSFQLA